MILDKDGQIMCIKGISFYIGMPVIAQNCMYIGLVGVITEIRTDCDLETENHGPDIYCSFQYNGEVSARLGMESDENCFDRLIMSHEMLQTV